MTELRKDLPEPPPRIAALPVDKRGYPVPAFVALIEGEPDHRIIDPVYMPRAMRQSACWICGSQMGTFKSFVIGPMCTVNRISSEPPSHLDCALYAVRACPFLTKPHMRRRDAGLPENIVDPPGGFLQRNPGAMCVWTTKKFSHEVHRKGDGSPGLLFFLDEPTSMQWFTEGRPATRAEVLDSITSGLPVLQELAEQDGPKAVYELGRLTGVLLLLLDRMGPA